MTAPKTYADWVPKIKACLKQERYGDPASCALCLAVDNPHGHREGGCSACIATKHCAAIGGNRGCGQALRVIAGDDAHWSDIPAVHRWLNALLAWTKRQAAKEACENCGYYSYAPDDQRGFIHVCTAKSGKVTQTAAMALHILLEDCPLDKQAERPLTESKEEKMTDKTFTIHDLLAKCKEKETMSAIIMAWPNPTVSMTAPEIWERVPEDIKDCWKATLKKLIGPRPAGEMELSGLIFRKKDQQFPNNSSTRSLEDTIFITDRGQMPIATRRRASGLTISKQHFYMRFMVLAANRVMECAKGTDRCHIEPEDCQAIIEKSKKEAAE
jgi:hypothetical protein